MGLRSRASGALVVLSGVVWFLQRGPAVEEDIALFTHERGELHCPDRELRHLCVPELRDFLEQGESAREAAYSCCATVLEEKGDDFYMLKNMTHLLLDLDGNQHVFDRTGRDDEFIELGMKFGRALLHHPDCLSDFDLDEYQCRCYPLYSKILILKMKNAGRWEEAQALYDDATSFEWRGQKSLAAGEAVRWSSLHQTPQIVMPGLRKLPVWPRESWDGPNGLPIAHLLEQHAATIARETRLVLEHAPEEWSPTYRFLFDKGDWNQVLLYHARQFRPECEQLFPETCKLLREWLPSKPGVPWVSDQTEQVLLLRLEPGTTVELHSGPANSILNVHLGLFGLEGARLGIAGKNYTWDEGKVIAWDGSYDHTVDCTECKEARLIMMVRYMHPDVTSEMFVGHERTHFEEI